MSAAHKTRSTFGQSCAIRCDIAAPPERIWALLTDAARFPSWNTTVTRIDGTIALGQKLAIAVPLAPGRTFRPKVVRFEPDRVMVWRDGFAPMFRGVRTFTLTPKPGGTEFAMVEVLSGLMVPLARASLPDFGPAFETYAADLKRAAERP
ncbi:MAG TPA: SRPBCC domain-containing protein [Kofleriaceae bacterium]|nr:SRPBCC domain-containing protein [Kofleriaceae bacterium]